MYTLIHLNMCSSLKILNILLGIHFITGQVYKQRLMIGVSSLSPYLIKLLN